MVTKNTSVVNDSSSQERGSSRPTLLTVHDVARMLNCSARTVYRLCDSGRLPRPVKLGALVRWSRPVVEKWIADGCPKAGKEVL